MMDGPQPTLGKEIRMKNVLVVRIQKEREQNIFCPRCGVIVPPGTKCIPSPTREEVHYHASCFLAFAEQLGRRIAWSESAGLA
jgi:hypothetical protein